MQKGLIVLSAALVYILFLGCTSTPKGETHLADIIAENLDVKKWEQKMKEKPGTLLDVRTQGEFNQGHIADAKLIDWYSKDFNKEAGKLDRNKPVYVYCKSGGRSQQAMKRLTQLGFIEVYNLQGGYMAWSRTH